MGTKMINRHSLRLPIATALLTAVSINANAYQYETGDLSLTFDSAISVGAGWRTEKRNPENIGPANGGTHKHDTSSQDNSNMLFDRSTYTKLIKGSHELEANYLNYGLFIRGRYFYDVELKDESRVNVGLPAVDPEPTDEALDNAGANAEFLDVFLWGNWSIGDQYLSARVGRQVISWGEGVFFPNGINSINPVSVSALRAPGAELKEAFIPIDALHMSYTITNNISVEAFVQDGWRETDIDPCGTMFSTTDLAGPGCNDGFYAGGQESGFTGLSNSFNLGRGEDITPGDSGQRGFAVRYFAESIETEFAFYYMKYNSRLPILSGHAPDITENTIAQIAAAASAIVASLDRDPPLVIPASYIDSAILTPAYTAGGLNGLADEIFDTGNALADQGASLAALLLPYADYTLEYVEGIELYGVSFNTAYDFGIPGGATAISGEFSFRPNQPFQIEDSALLPGLIGLPSQLCSDTSDDCFDDLAFRTPDTGTADGISAGEGEFISGGVRENFIQAEIAFIHFFDRVLAADRWTVVLDMAFNIANIPDKEELLLNSGYNATLTPAWGPLADLLEIPENQREDQYYPTKRSWGYKAKFIGDYSNVFAGINLKPSITFSHDVDGVSPGPGGNFLEGRKALAFGLQALYLNQYTGSIGYTRYYGAEPYNLANDRDFITLSAGASF